MPQSEITVLDSAYRLVAAGLSVLPISQNGSKRPYTRSLPITGQHPDGNPKRGWSALRRRLPTEEELELWFGGWGPTNGMAVIGGAISGGLLTIDIDSTEHVEPWLGRVSNSGLLEKLVLVQTPRPGLHAYYRHDSNDRNQILAQRTVIDPVEHTTVVERLIETRGEGGYAIVPPTPGCCHPSGRPYVYRSNRQLTDVQTLTDCERETLLEISRSFHELPPTPPKPARAKRQSKPLNRSLPGDDFDFSTEWEPLLEEYGWSYLYTSDDVDYWTRPGKSEGTSATVNYDSSDKLFVFTSEAYPLEPDRMYSKFEFLTFMEFGGDFKEAAKVLRLRGFGRQIASAERPKRRTGRSTRSRHRPR